MIWTRTKPTKAGWWWYRYTKNHEPYPQQITNWKGELRVQLDSSSVTLGGKWTGEWSSEPIQEPKEDS